MAIGKTKAKTRERVPEGESSRVSEQTAQRFSGRLPGEQRTFTPEQLRDGTGFIGAASQVLLKGDVYSRSHPKGDGLTRRDMGASLTRGNSISRTSTAEAPAPVQSAVVLGSSVTSLRNAIAVRLGGAEVTVVGAPSTEGRLLAERERTLSVLKELPVDSYNRVMEQAYEGTPFPPQSALHVVQFVSERAVIASVRGGGRDSVKSARPADHWNEAFVLRLLESAARETGVELIRDAETSLRPVNDGTAQEVVIVQGGATRSLGVPEIVIVSGPPATIEAPAFQGQVLSGDIVGRGHD